jgi:hypothetical protein
MPGARLAATAGAAYTSGKWPWIEAVWRIHHASHLPLQSDAIRLTFPRAQGRSTGPHIIHWMWGGYKDCIDGAVAHRYPPSRPATRPFLTPGSPSMGAPRSQQSM